MKNLNFKNFNYAMIDSARSGYREVLVTYTIDGKTARKCVFVKEVKGKDKNYYFAQAKKEINASIKDGSLAKSASKQLARGGATKPVLIALSCVLAAGALGTGGYFLGSYLGGGGGSPVVTDGHTVVLYGGEGVFENNKTYLIFNNVKDKTALGDIEGYALPTCGDFDFLKWNGPVEDEPYGTSFKITEDIVLSASFFEGIKYLKAQAVSSVNEKLNHVIKDYELVAGAKELLEKIYEKTKDTINSIQESSDPAAVADARNTISDLTECANETLDIAGSAGVTSLETVAAIEKTYSNAINHLAKETSAVKRSTLVKFNSGYMKAFPAIDSKIVDQTYDQLVEMLNKYKEETDSLSIRLLGYFAKGVIAGSGYFKDPKQISIIGQLPDWFEKLSAVGLKEDDADTINWVGDFFSYYYYTSSKYDFLDPQIEPVTPPTTYGGFVKVSGDDAIAAIIDYLSTSSLARFAVFSLNNAMIKALANVESELPPYAKFNELVYGGTFASYQLLREGITSLTNQLAEGGVSEEFKEAGKSMINKILACFKNVMEAFSIWRGEGYDYLFVHNEGPTIDGIILEVAQNYVSLQEYENGSSVLLDNYVTLTEKAIELAKNSLIEKAKMDYEDLFIVGALMIDQARSYDSIKDKKSFFNAISSFLSLVIPISVDSGLVYDRTSRNIMPKIFTLFNPQIKNAEIDNSAYFSFLVDALYGSFACANHIYAGCSSAKERAKYESVANGFISKMLADFNDYVKLLLDLSNTAPTTVIKSGETIRYIFADKWPEVLLVMGQDLDKKFDESLNLFKNIFKAAIEPLGNLKGSDLLFEAYFDTISSVFEIIPKLQNVDRLNDAILFTVQEVPPYFYKRFERAVELKEVFITGFINKVEKDMPDADYNSLKDEVKEELNKIVYS